MSTRSTISSAARTASFRRVTWWPIFWCDSGLCQKVAAVGLLYFKRVIRKCPIEQ